MIKKDCKSLQYVQEVYSTNDGERSFNDLKKFLHKLIVLLRTYYYTAL